MLDLTSRTIYSLVFVFASIDCFDIKPLHLTVSVEKLFISLAVYKT